MKEVLKEIGLSNNESAIYLVLLELGESLASRVSEKAIMNRSQAYDVLEELTTKGLVTYTIRNNRKYFSAASPSRLKDHLKEKQAVIEEQKKKLDQMMPSIMSLQRKKESSTKAEIYSGK